MNLTVYAGNYPQLYLSEVKFWIEDMEKDGIQVYRLACGKDIFTKDGEWTWEDTCLNSSTSLFDDEQAVLITNVDELDAKQVGALAKRLADQDASGSYQFCLTMLGSTIPKPIMSIATDPFVMNQLDGDDRKNKGRNSRANKVCNWLNDRGAQLSVGDCQIVLDFCGEDTNMMADAMAASVLSDDKPSSAQDLLSHIPNIGSSAYFDLVEAIFKGDRHKVGEVLVRQEKTISNESGARGILAMTKKRLIGYGLSQGLDPQSSEDKAFVEEQLNRRGGYYIIQEARAIGIDRLSKCMEIVTDAEISVCARHSDPGIAIATMSNLLCQQVFLAKNL